MTVWFHLRQLSLIGSLILLSTSAVCAQGGKIALTFDDLPALTILPDQGYVDYLNLSLLRKLRAHRYPATGFVNEGKLDQLERSRQVANLGRWLEAGMDLGNHTYSHESANKVGSKAYIADIIRGEPITKALLAAHSRDIVWFRHPYLETGYPARDRNEIDDWLRTHGYRIAPVTIDADDWEFAEPYDAALARQDVPLQRHIKDEYLAYTAKRIAWSQASARVLFGRDIAHVMLLHCTRLNADTFDALAMLFNRAHLKPVSLAEAMRDPVYAKPDRYSGKDGINWLERWAIDAHKELPTKGDEDPPADIEAQYDRVDSDR